MGRVVVAGSINMDVVAVSPRAPRAGETVAGSSFSLHPGGKGANQAVAAAMAGAETAMVGRVGSDAFGAELVRFLVESGVAVDSVTRLDGASGAAVVVVEATGENRIVVVAGANGALTVGEVTDVQMAAGDVAVAQLEIPPATTAAFLRHARACGTRTIFNPAPMQSGAAALLEYADVVVVNEGELAALAGRERASAGDGVDHLRRPGQVVVVTHGARGAVAVSDEGTLRLPGHAVDVLDTTGAGDCFVGYLAAGLARGDGLEESLLDANQAAAICVTRAGAGPSMPARSEVSSARRLRRG